MKHVILLHYYCEAEISRYLRIAEFLREYSRCSADYEFLLLAASCISPSQALEDAFARIAPAKTFPCRKTKDGYLEGSAAAFWEGMGYVNSRYDKDGGFAFWLESDTMPIKSNWVDLLELEWKKHPDILVMGLYVPWLSDTQAGVVPAHINGGGCYAKDMDNLIPASYKSSNTQPFDISLSQYAMKVRKFHKSGQFVFADQYKLCRDIRNPKITILNGHHLNQDELISRAISLLKDPVMIKEEIKRIGRLPADKKICCRLWNPRVKLCMIHDCVRYPFKRIFFIFDKIFFIKAFPILNMFRKRS